MRSQRSLLLSAALVLSIGLAYGVGLADDLADLPAQSGGGVSSANTVTTTTSITQPVDDRLRQLEQRQAALEELIKTQQKEAQAQTHAEILAQLQAKAKDAPIVGAGSDGFFLKSADDLYQLRIRGYIQADGRFLAQKDAVEGSDTFLLRRARPIFEGTVYKDFDFRIMPDFGSGQAVLQDAYVEWKAIPEAKVRVGKFKAPFGLEQLASDTDLLFVERALPTNLVPNRDLGVQLSGDLWKGVFNYAVGIFNGNTDGGSNDSDIDNGKEVVARVFVHPFRNSDNELLKGFGFGGAVSYGDQTGTLASPFLPSYKSFSQTSFFKYRGDGKLAGTTVANGEHVRWSPQAYYYYKSFGLLGEFVNSSQHVTRNTNSDTLENTGWQVTASYVLTGEKASYKGVVPNKPFDLRKGQFGAFEVAARVNQLDVDDRAFPVYADPAKSARSATAAGVGLNWYLNKNVKVMVDYEQTGFTGGSPTGDRPDEKAILFMVQVAF